MANDLLTNIVFYVHNKVYRNENFFKYFHSFHLNSYLNS